MAVNPNWPTLFAEGNFASNPYYVPNATQVYTDLTARLYKAWSVRRGKQFELDAVQPGEFNGSWVNKDGFLDPSNTSGPLGANVLPFRGYRMRAQYPSSVNLLSGDVATGGDVTPLAAGSTSSSVTSAYGTPVVAATATAWQGSQVWQAPIPGGATTGLTVLAVTYPGVSLTAGTPYTMTWQIRSVTTGANPVLAPAINWMGIGGSVSVTSGSNVTLTGGPSATWTAVTLSGTVPSGAIAAGLQFTLATPAPAGAWNFQADGIQWEQNSAATSFVAPGVNFPVFAGLIERYPQSWSFSGTYGLVQPVCVDTMALLSQTLLKEAFVMDVVATGPSWLFPLNDPNGSTTFQEQAGRTPAAGLYSSSYGAGTLTSGNSISAASPVGKFSGTNGPVITVNNPTASQGTVVDLTPAGITGTPATGGWSRMLAFRTGNTTAGMTMAAATTGYSPGWVGFNSNWYLSTTGVTTQQVIVGLHTDSNVANSVTHPAIVNDNNWHLAIFTLSASGKTLSLYVDGVRAQSIVGTDMHATLQVNDSIGGDEYKNAGIVSYGVASWQGDLALYAQWGTELAAATVTSLYTSWRTAWQGDTSDQRYSRILGWAGYQGASVLDSGVTTAMGAATDVAGVDALACLQNVVNTESGRHFVGADGTINFQNRKRMFQAITPVWVFGENQSGAEIPYVDMNFDYDPTHLSNAIQVTQVAYGTVFYANDTASQTAYGVRNLTRSSQSTDAEEVGHTASFLLSLYKDPHMRVRSLRIDAAANPALWASVLAFELGQYVQINRRDQAGVRPTITMYGFIEQITHTGDDAGGWLTDLQISLAPTTPYATFTSLRTTLNATAAAGQPVITINALPDAATNPVRSELTGGQVLTISGGGNSESRVIDTGGVQNQAAGYTTAQITLQSNLSFTYPAGSSVVEATGANWDSLAMFDAVQFCF